MTPEEILAKMEDWNRRDKELVAGASEALVVELHSRIADRDMIIASLAIECQKLECEKAELIGRYYEEMLAVAERIDPTFTADLRSQIETVNKSIEALFEKLIQAAHDARQATWAAGVRAKFVCENPQGKAESL